MKLSFAGIIAGLTLSSLPTQAAIWRGSWAASPAIASPDETRLPETFRSPKIHDQTIVQHLRLSAGGQRLRLRLSNEMGQTPLRVGHVRVKLLDDQGRPLPDGAREVTFSGARQATILAQSPLVSDPIDLPTLAMGRLAVSLYFPGDVSTCSCHAIGGAVAEISPAGDYTDRPFTPSATTQSRAFLTGVEVESGYRGPVVVAFGDSITDGYRSTLGGFKSWPERLAERVAQGSRGAVLNAGISGNRVLGQNFPVFGLSALARFDRDVLAVPGVTHVIVLEGINDIGSAPTPAAADLIAAYRQLIARAHGRGVKVILATLTPVRGFGYFRPETEAVRVEVNRWIREQKEGDGAIDFDLVLRDPRDPQRLRADYQSGDWIHPNDAGYRAMGDAVPLSLFH